MLLTRFAVYPKMWTTIAKSISGRSAHDTRIRYLRLTREKSVFKRWTTAEDELLKAAIAECGTRDWGKVAERVPGKTRPQCTQRWGLRLSQHGLTRNAWNKEDDALLIEGVKELGVDGKWPAIAARMSGKSGRECKTRYDTRFRACALWGD